jgi:hypothetical protein
VVVWARGVGRKPQCCTPKLLNFSAFRNRHHGKPQIETGTCGEWKVVQGERVEATLRVSESRVSDSIAEVPTVVVMKVNILLFDPIWFS